MSFREKMTWVMAVATLVAAGVYFYPMAHVIGTGQFIAPASASLGMLAVVVLVVIAIAGSIVSALTNVKEASAPLDERERQIAVQGNAVGASVLAGWVMLLVVVAHIVDTSAWLVPGLVAALVVSQMAAFVVQLYLYRRG